MSCFFSHASPGDDKYHFNEEDAEQFRLMIENAISQIPNLKLYSVAGHNHRQGIVEYGRFGKT